MNLSNIRPYRVENPSSRPPDPTLTLVIFCACDDYGKDGYPYRPLPYVCVVKPGTCILRRQRQISGARPDFHTCNFLCMRRLWLGWLLMRRRQVETSSDLGRPPDPTFCMYLSPVDTSINRPPVRPCKVRPHHRPTMVASVCMRRRQVETWSDPGRPTRTRLSACIMVRMATHTGRFCMYASPTSRNMVRSRPAARPDFLHVSVARRHIDKSAARPSMQSPYVFPMSCQLVTFVTFITAT